MTRLSAELYRKLYLARQAEQKIRDHYHEDEIKTPVHMSLGQEAIAIGVCHALRTEDQIFGTYRAHASYLAKTDDLDDFFAEMYGKETALLKGKGGSMHLCAPGAGFMGSSAIVASIIPVAVGAAFANRQLGNGKTTAVFFGDGAIDEGNFWESFNTACVMRLPVLFVCEDNGLAVHTPTSMRHGYDSITAIAARFHCSVVSDDTTDVERIYRLTQRAVRRMKKTGQPCFMYLRYYRYLEHVGVNEDFAADYRPRAEYEAWYAQDSVLLQRKRLLEQGMTEADIKVEEARIDARIAESAARARAAPFAGEDELYKGVLA